MTTAEFASESRSGTNRRPVAFLPCLHIRLSHQTDATTIAAPEPFQSPTDAARGTDDTVLRKITRCTTRRAAGSASLYRAKTNREMAAELIKSGRRRSCWAVSRLPLAMSRRGQSISVRNSGMMDGFSASRRGNFAAGCAWAALNESGAQGNECHLVEQRRSLEVQSISARLRRRLMPALSAKGGSPMSPSAVQLPSACCLGRK